MASSACSAGTNRPGRGTGAQPARTAVRHPSTSRIVLDGSSTHLGGRRADFRLRPHWTALSRHGRHTTLSRRSPDRDFLRSGWSEDHPTDEHFPPVISRGALPAINFSSTALQPSGRAGRPVEATGTCDDPRLGVPAGTLRLGGPAWCRRRARGATPKRCSGGPRVVGPPWRGPRRASPPWNASVERSLLRRPSRWRRAPCGLSAPSAARQVGPSPPGTGPCSPTAPHERARHLGDGAARALTPLPGARSDERRTARRRNPGAAPPPGDSCDASHSGEVEEPGKVGSAPAAAPAAPTSGRGRLIAILASTGHPDHRAGPVAQSTCAPASCNHLSRAAQPALAPRAPERAARVTPRPQRRRSSADR